MKIQKNSTLNSVFPDSKNIDFAIYDGVFNKFGNIIKDVCALANSEGGVIYIGVNPAYRCIGVTQRSSGDWLDNILKLSRVIYSTICMSNYQKIRYVIKNYIVLMNGSETYISEIIVQKALEKCILNSYGNISYYERINRQTVSLPIDEDLINNFLLFDIGDIYNAEEGETIEFKSTFYFLNTMDGIGKYISSFANNKGGSLLIGIDDARTIVGVKIDTCQDWDKIKRDILWVEVTKGNGSSFYSEVVNNVEFLSQLKINKIPLKTKNYYLVKIDVPQHVGPEPILGMDKGGNWTKWVRVLSSSIKDERYELYTKNFYSNLKNQNFQLKKQNQTLISNMRKDGVKKWYYDLIPIVGFVAILALGISR